jgi:hypothetical protein
MLTIAEAAGTRLAEILAKEGLPDEVAIRLVFEGAELAMQPDGKRPGDTTFEHEARRTLIVDEQVAASLADDALDAGGARLAPRGAKGKE